MAAAGLWDVIEDKADNLKDKAVEEITDTDVEDRDVKFKYYNKDFPDGIEFTMEDFDVSKLQKWRKQTQMKIITHGWRSSVASDSVELIRKAYIETKDFNIFTVDWSGPASSKFYPVPAGRTLNVGKKVSKLIMELVKKQMVTWAEIHLIGHSLGAHTMGVAGGTVEEGKIARLSALDPAGPIFNAIERPNIRVVDTTDADFVDVIHTAGGETITNNDVVYGSSSSVGTVDFYPNGGHDPQPGCFGDDTMSCSHGRAYEFFAESIRTPHAFKSWECDSFKSFLERKCDAHKTAFMGDQVSLEARGNYYLVTNPQPPYGKGE